MFRRILIANRGEIACRIIGTCRRLGVETVAVYSDADADALHVRLADQAVRVGGAAPGDSYLQIDRIIEAARATGAEAIHPGYGFLAENPAFARACAEAQLVFIGPSPATMDRMGSKADAKATMEAAGVPTVPGYHGEDQSEETLATEAERIGFPLMIKAAAGGGGKGMRIVRAAEKMTDALASARREARNAFGDDRVILERYIERPRHIEVQVFGDVHGNIVHLFERDCSSQRRYQKIIEEAPAPGLSEELRRAIHQAGVAAARAVDYVNAGTVELILGADDEFFFMEMNTRLQVEHPVTEAITGIDLVEWQLRVAAGEPLPLDQDAIVASGHAIEARIYAEDPAQNFLPSSGTIEWLALPELGRVDTGVCTGDTVTVHYDPMLAKLTTWGDDRRAALARMRHALARTAVFGPTTNLDFLSALVAHPVLVEARIHTAYLDGHLNEVYAIDDEPPVQALFAAAIVRLLDDELGSVTRQATTTDPWSPWGMADGWRIGHAGRRVVSLRQADRHHRDDSSQVDAWGYGGRYRLAFGNHRIEVDQARLEEQRLTWRDASGRQHRVVLSHGRLIQVAHDQRLYQFIAEDPFAVEEAGAQAENRVTAPMPGRVVALRVNAGDTVNEGQELAVMEAMKMELSLTASMDGKVTGVHATVGEFVEADTLLIELE